MDRSLVRLRPLEEADVDDLLGWVNDPEIVGHIAAFHGDPFTREQELAYIRRIQASTEDRVFTVLAADDGRYLGQVGLHQIHARSRVGRLACVIATRREMSRGFGTAAIAHLLDHAFGELSLHKVWLLVFATNVRARAIYGRLGFREEGLLREEYLHDGTWRDMVRMGLLASEWTRP